jgi:hypothetical protein
VSLIEPGEVARPGLLVVVAKGGAEGTPALGALQFLPALPTEAVFPKQFLHLSRPKGVARERRAGERVKALQDRSSPQAEAADPADSGIT